MKIHSTHTNFREALDKVIDTLPDKGKNDFTVERVVPKSKDVPAGTIFIYSIEDSSLDIAEVPKGETVTEYIVLEFGLDMPEATNDK